MSEAFRVLIVDDSTVFRSQIRAALEGVEWIKVVGYASNGKLACEFMKNTPVDLLTLDLEMPEMNGLETMAEMHRLGMKAKVIVFSAQTRSGAEVTLTALRSGASDFLAKPNLDAAEKRSPAEVIGSLLIPKIQQFRDLKFGLTSTSHSSPSPLSTLNSQPLNRTPFPAKNWALFRPKIVVIASSTGGPVALETLFGIIRGPFSIPILIAQHMPPVFTATLAERLSRISGVPIAEATHMGPVTAGKVFIAPGDRHLKVANFGGSMVMTLDQEPQRNSVRPAADFLFESVTACYGASTLGIVLTGMGADGKDGAIAIKKASGGVMIQNRETCVVFGMPGAVYVEGAYDKMGSLEQLASHMEQLGICKLNDTRAA